MEIHQIQKDLWEKEHSNPNIFTHLDSREVSGGVEKFWEWYTKNTDVSKCKKGLEIGCGKGRNALWLSEQGAEMSGFDFSKTAIHEAQRRSLICNMGNKTDFLYHDAISKWPYENESFDFVLDCFATVDIESNIQFVFDEISRVLKPGGHFFMYTNSIESQIYQESKFHDKIFRYPHINKTERVYSHEELNLYTKGMEEVAFNSYDRYSNINDTAYKWHHYWIIYKKI